MVSSVLISDAVEHLTAGLTPEDGKKVMEPMYLPKSLMEISILKVVNWQLTIQKPSV